MIHDGAYYNVTMLPYVLQICRTALNPRRMTDRTSTRNATGLYNVVDEYEVSFPFEENQGRSAYLNQSEQILEEAASEMPPHYSPFMLITNLRTHLCVSLEKNSWLQKRIEDLEEERNFLRCQLERFVSSMRTPESNRKDWGVGGGEHFSTDFPLGTDVISASIPDVYPESQHTSLNYTTLKPPPERAPSPPPSPMTTRSGMLRKHVQSQPHTCSSRVPVKQEVRVIEEDKYFEEDGYMEEEEVEEEDDSSDEKMSKKRGSKNGGEPRMKMRRVFRITRGKERQRVKDPDGVLHRYQKILLTYQRLRSMSKAFQVHRVDRNTMASTSPIAELLLVAPEKVAEVGEFESSKEKLLDYARRCYKALDEPMHAKVAAMKKNHLLLPISYRFRN
ncbi:coiled-coil domain-containing protein 106-like isoform X1 [Salvelinus namaycush]|uniref:Coiled-coil domain-containing protein 106-like isoform X1 n=1 Tax=Salvelinus namaycush TaxID=8040 RepID=A0A8U0PNC4_SALNM|nr:coiled-coil domain-containing protein 106-like isoform X1 [Salvelinus namaycush]